MSVIAMEIGGTKQQIAVGNPDGSILELRSVKLGEKTNPQNIISWLDENVWQLIKKYGARSAVIGYGGPVDLNTGTVIWSVQVDGWQNINLEEHFRYKYGIKCLNTVITA